MGGDSEAEILARRNSQFQQKLYDLERAALFM